MDRVTGTNQNDVLEIKIDDNPVVYESKQKYLESSPWTLPNSVIVPCSGLDFTMEIPERDGIILVLKSGVVITTEFL